MNNIKEMNGRYYQECEVVMLAIDKKAPFYLDKVIGLSKAPQDRTIEGLEYQHLYFLSNEEIKVGDWVLETLNKVIFQLKVEGNDYRDTTFKKIIATTDISLELPQSSQSFIQAYIKAYNESKPITKVLVEMEEIDSQDYHAEIDYFGKTDIELEYELKINSSNEITIKKIKDNYTREEVIELLSKHFVKAGSKIGLGQNVTEFTKIWIEENL